MVLRYRSQKSTWLLAHCKSVVFLLQLSSDVSGRNAETKVRGRLKEKESEEKEKKESEAKLRQELESKYSKWNRG